MDANMVYAQVEGLEEENALLEAKVKELQEAYMVSTQQKQVRLEFHACASFFARDISSVTDIEFT